MKVCGSLSVQEQQFPCEISGKQREGDGAGSGGSLTPLCLNDCREKGSRKENWGSPKAFQGQKDDHMGWFVLLLASHRCKKLC